MSGYLLLRRRRDVVSTVYLLNVTNVGNFNKNHSKGQSEENEPSRYLTTKGMIW